MLQASASLDLSMYLTIWISDGDHILAQLSFMDALICKDYLKVSIFVQGELSCWMVLIAEYHIFCWTFLLHLILVVKPLRDL